MRQRKRLVILAEGSVLGAVWEAVAGGTFLRWVVVASVAACSPLALLVAVRKAAVRLAAGVAVHLESVLASLIVDGTISVRVRLDARLLARWMPQSCGVSIRMVAGDDYCASVGLHCRCRGPRDSP